MKIILVHIFAFSLLMLTVSSLAENVDQSIQALKEEDSSIKSRKIQLAATVAKNLHGADRGNSRCIQVFPDTDVT